MPNRNQTFDSNGPEVRIRGNAYQVHEKYLTLARDASASGDRIMSENYLQHAEHYYRIINAINEAYQQTERPQPGYEQPRESGARDGGQREAGPRDNGARDNGQREGGPREGGQQRVNGQQRDRSQREFDPRDMRPPELEFGEDPRQQDESETELDSTDESSPITELAPINTDTDGGESSDNVEQQETARAPRPRRRVPRQRRATGNGSAESVDASPGEADGE